ncbi:type I restriction enzyme, S subunit [Allopseudospirillum japonicum]|uniref:Type I restriction enzyme, S subunit n=2 Tax=Allopseudospirillum japonicum TaxID=64971 RepID=A0A1H6UKE2_9GAMM|nr:type I restriction enzyme, S subunit [Allopseudospirillum japonicum]
MTNFSGKNLHAGTGSPQGGGMDSRRNDQVAEVSPKYLAEAVSNAVPLGYKQTEVGVIPEDWEVQDFGSLFQSTVSKKAIKPGTLVSFVGMQDVTEQAQLADQHLIPIENVRSGFTYFERGDVLIAKITPCFENGKGCHTELLHSDIGFGSTEFHVLRANDISDSRFIYYWSNREVFRKSLEPEMVGSAGHRRVPLSAISNYQIPVPPKAEQTAIANALSDVDALISELEKLIAKKQAIKTATMQQLLTGKIRLTSGELKVENGERKPRYQLSTVNSQFVKHSELGEIPEDWEVVCFDQLKDKKDNWAITGGPFGSNLKASDYTENGVRVIQLQNIGDGVFKNDDFVYTSYKKANELISCNIYPDEIILSKMGDPVARACLIPHFHNRYVMCSDGIRLKVDSQRYSEKFVFYFLNYPLFRNQALDASTGSTRKRIGLTELRDLLLCAPPKEEQTAIATILSDMDAEIRALEQRLGKTRQIKQGMMQELLTGRTRLRVNG